MNCAELLHAMQEENPSGRREVVVYWEGQLIPIDRNAVFKAKGGRVVIFAENDPPDYAKQKLAE